MEHDQVDHLMADWQSARPDLDGSALHLVGRIFVLAQHLEKRVNQVLAECGLTLGTFDILATLRRHSTEGGLTPTQLMRSVMLSSGGMTNRLDRLEEAGLIQRQATPDDRRGVLVLLTELGRAKIDQATEARFHEAAESLPNWEAGEAEELTRLLRKWLIALVPVAHESASESP
ncbi:MarR family winged helix-turn-helix transcriptional regulator [Tuwongella immobilis]|uniref:HTH marR-type domain-containing protein n=1 Tax=Tuwongella immobilis TaxID=692036 RepID=A0A6C2YJR2_9BACT|nr:MarR family transcriptional regulator [Tuwongella immobilis]VIP01617.1 family transcriptional regulator : MarR family transcriptional regulator OS=Aeromonas caviae GN=MC64_18030 PE=4 SV=1: MarR [Tuwongella immobilis]VTR98940.1 family transcriptional regulator : MarR family transcriptional regulator OS=Aeromonas caviae GN=MC64_18030 PE=4 SV=1: MarR [Tuwongella immobilis]